MPKRHAPCQVELPLHLFNVGNTQSKVCSGAQATAMNLPLRRILLTTSWLATHCTGVVGGWGGGRQDSAASHRSSRSSFGGTDTTGHLLDMDVDEPLEPLDFQVAPCQTADCVTSTGPWVYLCLPKSPDVLQTSSHVQQVQAYCWPACTWYGQPGTLPQHPVHAVSAQNMLLTVT